MKTNKNIIHDSFAYMPPKMPNVNEKAITQPPRETTCYTDADVVWDSNFPRGLEVVSHGNWHYGPRGE